jgi:hypothetical protein
MSVRIAEEPKVPFKFQISATAIKEVMFNVGLLL